MASAEREEGELRLIASGSQRGEAFSFYRGWPSESFSMTLHELV
jgi:hypothetical protein